MCDAENVEFKFSWLRRHLKGEGRLDLCDIPLLTICKLRKHVVYEINNKCIIDE